MLEAGHYDDVLRMQGNHGEISRLHEVLLFSCSVKFCLQEPRYLFVLSLGVSHCLPVIACVCPAEIERDSSNNTFQSYLARYPAPYKQSNSTDPLYYSFDYGGERRLLS